MKTTPNVQYTKYCPSCWMEVERKDLFRYYCKTCDQTIRKTKVLDETGLEKVVNEFQEMVRKVQ